MKDHSPATVIPIILSAGGALRACDNDLLPEREDRYGYDTDEVRVQDLPSVQLWPRRGTSSSVVLLP